MVSNLCLGTQRRSEHQLSPKNAGFTGGSPSLQFMKRKKLRRQILNPEQLDQLFTFCRLPSHMKWNFSSSSPEFATLHGQPQQWHLCFRDGRPMWKLADGGFQVLNPITEVATIQHLCHCQTSWHKHLSTPAAPLNCLAGVPTEAYTSKRIGKTIARCHVTLRFILRYCKSGPAMV